MFSIECKSRKKFVATGWMNQAIKNNKDNKIPLVIVHVRNQRHDNDIVLLRLKDFKDLIPGNGKYRGSI